MKAPAFLLALLAVLLLVGNVKAQDHHPWHDFYREWREPGNLAASCCNARRTFMGHEVGDCEPTQAEVRAGQWWAWERITGRWIPIPDERLRVTDANGVRVRNPNIFDAHICWTPARGVICFVPPDTGG